MQGDHNVRFNIIISFGIIVVVKLDELDYIM